MYPFTNPMQTTALELNKNCTKKDFCLFYVSPVLQINGKNIAFLGELTKWVPVSSKRVQFIQTTDNGLIIQINGAINEKIEFGFSIDNQPATIECDFGDSTSLKIMLDGNNLTCQ